MNLIIYIVVSFTNVFLHIFRMLLVVKSGKLMASLANCICYTFSAVVVKFISQVSMGTAILVAATTNFFGCWIAMWIFEKVKEKIDEKQIRS